MRGTHYVAGVDGGASKTLALIADESGRILGRGATGSANYHNIGRDAASKSVATAVTRAKKQARLHRKAVDIAVVALAGIDSKEDRRIASRFVQASGIARKTYVVHDSVAALRAATRDGPGIIVISGTGCVAAGINAEGKYARVGGWGYLVDDEGSGYDMGRKALNRAFRAIDGRGERTRLTSIVCKHFGVRSLEEAIPHIYSIGLSVEEVAALAPLVSKAAHNDPTCREVLRNAGNSLADQAVHVARRLGMSRDSFTVTTFGGIFKSGPHLWRHFTRKINRELPKARVVRGNVEPVVGALDMAIGHLVNQREANLR